MLQQQDAQLYATNPSNNTLVLTGAWSLNDEEESEDEDDAPLIGNRLILNNSNSKQQHAR